MNWDNGGVFYHAATAANLGGRKVGNGLPSKREERWRIPAKQRLGEFSTNFLLAITIDSITMEVNQWVFNDSLSFLSGSLVQEVHYDVVSAP
jgi:hypothetical protein